MDIRISRSETDNTSAQYILILSVLVIIMLTGRAIAVDGTEKGGFENDRIQFDLDLHWNHDGSYHFQVEI